MIDPETIKAIAEVGATAIAGKPLIEKMLGPTSEYLGGVTLGLVKKADVNLGQIFAKAARRLGRKLEEPGRVPPRVLRAVVNEGAYVEDELGAEYFGGLLAASRTETGEDDRALALVAAVRDMSTYQIRLHYAIHRAVRELMLGRDVQLQWSNQRIFAAVYLPLREVADVLGIAQTPLEKWPAIVGHALTGLARLGLIYEDWREGDRRALSDPGTIKLPPDAPRGIMASPGAFGIELMLAVHGHADISLNRFLDPAVHFVMDTQLPPTPGALLTRQ